jgi:drug/metabolite transporter (DMT)-like permease
MLISAAAFWAISIVFVRSHRFVSTALALAPWQMLVAAALLLPLALALLWQIFAIDRRNWIPESDFQ